MTRNAIAGNRAVEEEDPSQTRREHVTQGTTVAVSAVLSACDRRLDSDPMAHRMLISMLALVAASGTALAAPMANNATSVAASSPAAATAAVPSLSAAAVSNTNDETPTEAVPDHRVVGMVVLGSVYVGIAAWMKLAWYHNKPTLPSPGWGDEGWFGDQTYAGGSDKFGHVWGTYMFARLGTKLLRDTGWGKTEASVISSGLSMAAYTLVELKDSYYYVGSYSDLTADAVGTAMALLTDNWPALDDALDYRVQWTPSVGFRRMCSSAGYTSSGCLDVAEDYSGERYMFAYKPRSIRAIRESTTWTRYLQFVDPVIGFQSHDYKPLRPDDVTVPRRQEIFIGVSLDLQAVVDSWLGDASSRAARVSRGIGHTVFEYMNLPFTSLPAVSYNHSPDETDFVGAFQ